MNKRTLIKVGAGLGVTILLVAALLGRNSAPVTQDNEVDSPAVPIVSSNDISKVSKLKLIDLKIDYTRTVMIEGPIMDDNIEPVVEYLVQLEQTSEPIYVLINSPGGSIIAGERFISAMESAKGPVVTICTKLCASMASFILEFGSKRYASNRSLLLFHDGAGAFEGNFIRVKNELAVIQRQVDKMDEYICHKSKVDCVKFRKDKLDETWLDSEDAFNQGFLDGVVKTPNNPLSKPLPINIGGDMKTKKTWSLENAH